MENTKPEGKSYRKLIQSLSKKKHEKLRIGKHKVNIEQGTESK